MKWVVRVVAVVCLVGGLALLLVPGHAFGSVEGPGFNCGRPIVYAVQGPDAYLEGVPDDEQVGPYGPWAEDVRQVCLGHSRYKSFAGLVLLLVGGLICWRLAKVRFASPSDNPRRAA